MTDINSEGNWASDEESSEREADALQLPLEDLSSFVVGSLHDPKQPLHCAACLTRCFELIVAHDRWCQILRNDHHDFWAACSRFISVGRSPQEMRNLMGQLAVCRCDMADETTLHLHTSYSTSMARSSRFYGDRPTDEIPQNEIGTFGFSLFSALYCCLKLVDANEVIMATGIVPPSTWPTSPSDLLPYGGEASVTAFIKLTHAFKEPVIFGVLGRIHLICRSLIQPFILSSSDLRDELLETFEPINRPISSFFTARQKEHMIDIFEDYLESSTTRADIFSQDGIVTWIGYKAKDILTLCDNSLKASPPRSAYAQSGYTDGVSSSLAQLAAQMRPTIPGAPPLTRMHREVQALTDRMKSPSPENKFFQLMGLIYSMRSERQECLNPNCSFVTEQFLRPLKLCTECRAIPYCSQECQLAGWNYPVCPHKEMCQKLHEFDFILDGLRDGALRSNAKTCVERGISEQLAFNLLCQLNNLRMVKTFATGLRGGR